MAIYTDKTIATFWGYVTKLSQEECWPWSGPKVRAYGRLYLGGKQPGRPTYRGAHVFSYEITYGEVVGLNVLHKCDNPECVNPDHLWLGTQLDNIKDMVKKGRQHHATGTKNGRAKLTDMDVSSIRALLSDKVPQYEIARMFHVSNGTVSHIACGRSWIIAP